MDIPEIVVLGGGLSSERDVSMASSRAVYQSLVKQSAAKWIDLDGETLPDELDPKRHVVFPVLHGGFGEGGGLQSLLEAAGFAYVGCDATASALCMDKARAKERAMSEAIPTAPAVYFEGGDAPSAGQIEELFGTLRVVVKPRREGSSVGLHFAESADGLLSILANIQKGSWMIEPRLDGYDVTVGVLNGHALGVVEILPKDGGVYDYAHKYTPGETEYRYPAALPEAVTDGLRDAAARVFKACGCRDFARIDFFRTAHDFVFLEINTIPGLTATSLLPKSAQCLGYDFDTLTAAMVAPALDRFHARLTT